MDKTAIHTLYRSELIRDNLATHPRVVSGLRCGQIPAICEDGAIHTIKDGWEPTPRIYLWQGCSILHRQFKSQPVTFQPGCSGNSLPANLDGGKSQPWAPEIAAQELA